MAGPPRSFGAEQALGAVPAQALVGASGPVQTTSTMTSGPVQAAGTMTSSPCAGCSVQAAAAMVSGPAQASATLASGLVQAAAMIAGPEQALGELRLDGVLCRPPGARASPGQALGDVPLCALGTDLLRETLKS